MTADERHDLELAWHAPESADVLPHPTRDRWQPLRLGLVDLFYYDDEQFWFHDGRLLLRGNNGTGKSKVLALTLPFLLDGSAAPRRVEPDADAKKRMEWNLLLGGAHSSTERTGYSWVEFGRRDADGSEHFMTLGIGQKAAAGRGIVKTWFFTTQRRIGDLRLVDADRVVITKERLRDELEATASGHVYDTQGAYRRAVDEALFRLGTERYTALVDLLIQLRQPQLSKRPDEKALSAALTEALAPLDQAVVSDIAESFRSLEEERNGVAQVRETMGAAEKFLRHYRAYAQVAARRRTTAMREVNSAYERAGRSLSEAQERLGAAEGEVTELEVRQQAATERRSGLDGELQGLRESPQMRDAQQLESIGRSAREAKELAASAQSEADLARRAAEDDAAMSDEASERYDVAAAEERDRGRAASTLARPAGLSAEHETLVADEPAAQRALTRRQEQISHVRRLIEAADRADAAASNHRTTLDAAEAESARRAEAVQSARETVDTTIDTHCDDVRRYLAGLSTLTVQTGVDELTDAARAWAQSATGDSPVRTAVDQASATAHQLVSRDRAAAEQTALRLSAELKDIAARVAELEAGHDPAPPPAPGRDAGARAGLAGAPLWRLTDFADAVPAGDQASLEAALQSSGLLDAWIFPDGTADLDGDVVIGPHGPTVPTSLADVLVPAVGPDDDVPTEAVAAVLSRIGLGEESTAALWVTTTGRWGAGPARGAWSKTTGEFIGAGAREAHRQQLLVTLRTRRHELEDELTAAREEVAEADRASERITAERTAYPSGSEQEVAAALERAAAAERELERAERQVAEARTAWEQASAAATQATDELQEQAHELSLGTTTAELDDVMGAVSAYRTALVEVRASTRALADATAARDRAVARAGQSEERHQHHLARWQEQHAAAETAEARYRALQDSVGASVAELQAKLSRVEADIAAAMKQLDEIAKQQIAAAAKVGSLQQNVANLEERREETSATRQSEAESLRDFTGTGLLRVALPGLEAPDPGSPEDWTITATLAVARAAESQLDIDASDDSWARAQQRVSTASTELTSQMSRHGHAASIEQHGDVLVARVRYLNEDLDVDLLADRLAQEVDDRERLLSAREREILENHLVNEVAGHLHELVLAADSQIRGMNLELAERKTSTGMQLRVVWRARPDGPAGLAATRDLLLRSDATWTPKDRSAIGEFLQAQIAQVRQADPAGGWQEHLAQALDYRQWHTFVVERRQNGQWRSASGPASGGEKALAVSIPLFAAASAHYNSAAPSAPRLILLDEAFAGVDDDSRAKSLGLLATFDLDVVMTSEREWGCYPQVPGLSIAQLSRVEGIDAVGVSRWRWDGRRRHRADEIEAGARAGVGWSDDHGDGTIF